MWTVDAHAHLTDRKVAAPENLRAELSQAGIKGVLLGGIGPEEWNRQLAMSQKQSPCHIWTCFGLHPYFVAEKEEDKLEKAFEKLCDMVDSATALGELGLDFRSGFLARGQSHQIGWFQRQLELATGKKKPTVLHIVRAHQDAQKVLKKFAPLPGMVHAFNSTVANARHYLELGLHISVGAALLHERNQDLHHAIGEIPSERLLLESDAPDQPPPGESSHDSRTVFLVAKKVAQLRGQSVEEILNETRTNFFTLTGISEKEIDLC
ncbi:MAG: TatD family hydrolase [Bdellovibrionales bacterium]